MEIIAGLILLGLLVALMFREDEPYSHVPPIVILDHSYRRRSGCFVPLLISIVLCSLLLLGLASMQ